jgi:hypothetical protein
MRPLAAGKIRARVRQLASQCLEAYLSRRRCNPAPARARGPAVSLGVGYGHRHSPQVPDPPVRQVQSRCSARVSWEVNYGVRPVYQSANCAPARGHHLGRKPGKRGHYLFYRPVDGLVTFLKRTLSNVPRGGLWQARRQLQRPGNGLVGSATRLEAPHLRDNLDAFTRRSQRHPRGLLLG